jgi:hypothetical protein
VLKWAAIFSLLFLLGLGAALLLRKGGGGEPSPAPAPEQDAQQASPQDPSGTVEPDTAPARTNEPGTPSPSVRQPPANAATRDGAEDATGRPNRQSGKATLVLRCNTLATVKENGRELGMTPLIVTLPAGAHQLELATPDGRAQKRVSVTLKAGESRTELVELALP